jgi:hypothetical protein
MHYTSEGSPAQAVVVGSPRDLVKVEWMGLPSLSKIEFHLIPIEYENYSVDFPPRI